MLGDAVTLGRGGYWAWDESWGGAWNGARDGAWDRACAIMGIGETCGDETRLL